jgi:ligand-binding SRPBCC domain-containing protein
MALFARSVVIDAPVHVVFAFHERDDALQLLASRFPPVRVISRSAGLATGSRVEFRVGFLHWIALHTAYEQNRLFEDQQIQGPFAKWVHRHEFEDLGARSRLTDRIEFMLPGGWLVNAAIGWAVRIELHRIFRYRHRVTKKVCESH